MPDSVECFLDVFSHKSSAIAGRVGFNIGENSVKSVFRGAVASEAKLLWRQKGVSFQECPKSVINESFKRFSKDFQQAYGAVVFW